MAPPLLSRDEATEFLRGRLHIGDDDVTRPSFDLLERIVVAVHRNLPFQSVTNMAVPLHERHVPGPQQVKQDMLAGLGGRSLKRVDSTIDHYHNHKCCIIVIKEIYIAPFRHAPKALCKKKVKR